MNTIQIKVELRRAACYEKNRYDLCTAAFCEALDWADGAIGLLRGDDWRTFYLLVAEAA